jgi:hypothetical protein
MCTKPEVYGSFLPKVFFRLALAEPWNKNLTWSYPHIRLEQKMHLLFHEGSTSNGHASIRDDRHDS